MNVKWAAWIVTTSLIGLGCKTANSTSPRPLAFDPSRDVYTHENSGFSFPATVDRFERHDGIQFHDEAGNDVSVPYNLDYNPDTQEAKAIGTVYVYPAPQVYSVSPMSGAGVRQALEWASNSQYEQSKERSSRELEHA